MTDNNEFEVLNNLTVERFSYFVENHKIKNKFKTYVETIVDIVEQKYFYGLIIENVKQYLHNSIIKKLEKEYSNYRFFKSEYTIEKNNLW